MTPTLIFAAYTAAGLLLFAGIACLIGYRREQLKDFRLALRVGQMVKVRLLSGLTIRARIVKINSRDSFLTVDIDSRRQQNTHISNIFRP